MINPLIRKNGEQKERLFTLADLSSADLCYVSRPMKGPEDDRWRNLTGGYRLPLDPRPIVAKLERESDHEAAWKELWDELHHQGDVGEASYAAVPLLVEAHRKRGVPDWNTYAIVSVIELARTRNDNPPLPEWLRDDYHSAIRQLAQMGAVEVFGVDEPYSDRSILSVIAIAKGLRAHGECLIKYSESELADLLNQV